MTEREAAACQAYVNSRAQNLPVAGMTELAMPIPDRCDQLTADLVLAYETAEMLTTHNINLFHEVQALRAAVAHLADQQHAHEPEPPFDANAFFHQMHAFMGRVDERRAHMEAAAVRVGIAHTDPPQPPVMPASAQRQRHQAIGLLSTADGGRVRLGGYAPSLPRG